MRIAIRHPVELVDLCSGRGTAPGASMLVGVAVCFPHRQAEFRKLQTGHVAKATMRLDFTDTWNLIAQFRH